ncbi:unnamed protein product [Rotaria sp. Silwood1]|nr:unnamed protein product [Rotaria sp. Silwood1]
MNDYGRRINSIIIKNLPTNYTESQLEELFSKFGRIISSKILPNNPNFDEYLVPLAKIDDIKSYAHQMFEAKSDLNGFSTEQILLLDYKTYSFNNETWGIGTGETFNMNKMLERKDELLKEMKEEKKRNNLKGILFSIVDIIKEKNLTLIPDDIEEKVVQEAFKVNIKHHIADLGSRLSRKKQIIPVLEKYFHQKS